MTALYRIIPCPACCRKWWRRNCRQCQGRELVAEALTPAEMSALTENTIYGLYRSQECAEAAIRAERA